MLAKDKDAGGDGGGRACLRNTPTRVPRLAEIPDRPAREENVVRMPPPTPAPFRAQLSKAGHVATYTNKQCENVDVGSGEAGRTARSGAAEASAK